MSQGVLQGLVSNDCCRHLVWKKPQINSEYINDLPMLTMIKVQTKLQIG